MPGRQSTTAPSLKKPKAKRQKAKRSLNALAIAEQQDPTRSKIRQSRLGKSEPEITKRKRQEENEGEDSEEGEGNRKRRKAGDKDRYGNEIEHGSDSSGNEWVIGQVNSDEDSDLDSDEAMGASDEERFEGFGFRGSQDKTSRPKASSRTVELKSNHDELQNFDLQEDSDDILGSDEESDGLGEDAVDLATMLDVSDGDEDPKQSPRQANESLRESAIKTYPEKASSAEEESMLSYSGDEDDARNSTKLASLQALVSSMSEQPQNTSRIKAPIDAQESVTPSEFGLSSKRKLTIADMTSSVTDPGLRKSLKLLADNEPKPISKRGGIPKKLDVPLPKRQQDRLDRAAAYKQSKETLNRWIDTVKHNRRAEHLSFPLKDPNRAAAPGSQRLLPTSYSQPLTDLESTIQNILKDSGLAPLDGKSEEEGQLQAFGELQNNTIPLEEVQARRAELRRARELLFREEIRAKRIKKIKSKSYRKVHRKERERNMQREKDALTAAGVDDSESEKERQDRRRAEERMGARHREGRWAKGVKDSGRAKWDEDARGGVTEMARRGEDLRRRIEGKSVMEDDDGMDSSESGSESDEEDDFEGESASTNRKLNNRLQRVDEDGEEIDPNDKGSRLASMNFMKKAEARRKSRNDAEVESLRRDLAGEETPSEEEGQEGKGRMSYGPMKKQTSYAKARESDRKVEKNEFEEAPGSDDEDGDGPDGAKDEDVDIVVDKPSVQAKANGVEKPSFSKKYRRNPHESQKEEASENPWLVETRKDSNASKRRVQNPDAGAIISNTPAVPIVPPPAPKPKPRSALKGARQAEASRQPVQTPKEPSNPTITTTKENNLASEPDSDSDSDAATLPFVLRNQQDLVRKAFAGDDVVATFEQEKRATVADEDDKLIDNALPGWGAWTGPGLGKKAQRRNRGKALTKVAGIAPDKRRDAKLDRVIINEKRVRKNGKYLASSLPHPFETRAQYERSLRLPVGPEWTTKETFQGMTEPRVLIKPGVIAPMSKPMI